MNATDRTITTPDGRQLMVRETGDPQGLPVVTLHGCPGSRLMYQRWAEDAASRGIRLISYDRPGYGGSSPHPGRRVADGAADVAAIARALGLDRLYVWGISGGGPHALACAALLPDLVAAAASLAAPTPYPAAGLDWLAGMGEDNVAEFGAAMAGRQAVTDFIEAMAPGLLSADPNAFGETAGSLLSPVDAAVMTQDLGAFLMSQMQEGIRASREGWVEDDLAFVGPWGFELSQIRVPLLLVQGQQDQMVPFPHGRWLAEHIPAAETRFLPPDGHLTLMTNHIPEVHAWLIEHQ